MRDFHKLRVWDQAHQATLDVYRATRTFPKEELYGLTAQMRRAATSADLKLLDRSAYARLDSAVVQVKRMLAGLLRKLRAES